MKAERTPSLISKTFSYVLGNGLQISVNRPIEYLGIFVAIFTSLTFYLFYANWIRYLGGATLPLGEGTGDLLPLFTLISAVGLALFSSYGRPNLRLTFIILTGFLLYFTYVSISEISRVHA